MSSIIRLIGIIFGSLSIFILLLIILIRAISLHPPKTPKTVSNLTELEEFLKKLTKSNSPPGLTAIVVKNSKIVYKKGFGFADPLKKIAAVPETVYHWWSISKIPTAIGIMQLHEKGLLDINEPVKKYLPFFDVEYPSKESEIVTIKHLLSHSGGIPNNPVDCIKWVHFNPEDAIENEMDFIKKNFKKYSKLVFEPGYHAHYSNINYMLLGAIIETASSKTYVNYMKENILKPLGMENTDFVYSQKMLENEAIGTHPVVDFFTPFLYLWFDMKKLVLKKEKNIFYLQQVFADTNPPTGYIGPATDMVNLAVACLDNGKFRDKQLLSTQTLDMMTDKKYVTQCSKSMKKEGADEYGLGFRYYPEGKLRKRSYIEHGGGGPGFATYMRLYLKESLGIILMANGTALDRNGITELFSALSWNI